MFEYHGWITIRETAEIDDDAVLLHAIVEGLRRRVVALHPCPGRPLGSVAP